VTFDDREMIERFKGGDPSGFAELVHKYQDRIYNLCRYMIGDADDARDAAQDSFVKAYGNLKSFRSDASLYTWLYRIAVNTCLDHRKKSRPDNKAIEATITYINDIQEDMQRMVVSHMLEFKSMLDKDQQKKFLDMIDGAMTQGREAMCP
jgi:RNA polymerase sigma factor (sigma-70 family)